MTNPSTGEVFGAKALNLAIIGMSVVILLGVLWQPAPVHVTAASPTTQIQQVVAKVPAPHHFAG
jgi:hypothetical protein